MKFAVVVFWWRHRHQLKAKGYSLGVFCEMTASYWRNLAGDGSTLGSALKQPTGEIADAFSRHQLRARW
jgi:hypothetical protein